MPATLVEMFCCTVGAFSGLKISQVLSGIATI